MKEYIDREALLQSLCNEDPSHMEDYYYNAIANAPAADVVEARRGKWNLGKGGVMYFCSSCGYAAHPREQEEWSFCPKCGAKMDGKRKE